MSDRPNTWIYKGEVIASHDDLPADTSDIVYLLTFTSGHQYIGKKTVRALRKLPPKKSQLALRKNFVRREIVNVPFLKYQGSTDLAVGLLVERKEILYLCSNKKTATYLETALLFQTGAVFSDRYINKNISGKFYDNDLDGLLDEEVSPDYERPLALEYLYNENL